MPSIQDFFKWGLDRNIPELIEPPAFRTIPDGYADLRGTKHYTVEQAERMEALGVGAEMPWINLGPGDKKIVMHEYRVGSSRLIKNTVGVGPATNKLTNVQWYVEWLPGTPGDEPYITPLPFPDNSVGAVHAHQFLEHFDGDTAIAILREIERVLVPGGVAFITVPYQGSSHWGQALDHKSTWNEETWAWLFDNEYYSGSEPWRLKVHACFIMGIVIRNLDLFTQLVKE